MPSFLGSTIRIGGRLADSVYNGHCFFELLLSFKLRVETRIAGILTCSYTVEPVKLSNMFCPCSSSYLMVEGIQTEQPRLVRSKAHHAPSSGFRAPLPMQVRPQFGAADGQKPHGQAEAQAGAYGQVSSYCTQGSHLRSRPAYDRRRYVRPRGIMKAPTEKFPFSYDGHRQSPTILRAKDRPNEVWIEIGRSSRSPSQIRQPPASDVVKVRVYKRDGNTTPVCGKESMIEEVRFRKGDIVVRDARSESSIMNNVESLQGWELPGEPQW
ncbi:hypothetical protein BDV19DRAFT_179937 [Aspergillus venezuelensis]